MRLMLRTADGVALWTFVLSEDTDCIVSSERLRMAHCATATRPPRCRACNQQWPCATRLHLDEVSDTARRRYAAQVHADWLAGARRFKPRSHDKTPSSRQ